MFGVHGTRHVDAAFFDAQVDAPPTCPAVGVLPQFKGSLDQIVNDYCQWYTRDEAGVRDAAYCFQGIGISDGDGTGALHPSQLDPGSAGLDMPRLSPEGDELWLRRGNGGAAAFDVFSYVRDHEWTFARTLTVPSSSGLDEITAPTRKVGGHRRFVVYEFQQFALVEYDDDGTQATPVHTYAQNDIGAPYAQFPNLTADGLRLVFVANRANDPSSTLLTFYSDRASLADLFSPAQVLTSAPVANDPFLTTDCGRIYTSGLGSIFYAEQI